MPPALRSIALATGIGRCLAVPFLLASVLLAGAARVSAQTYYVDNQSPAATDAGPGSEAVPYRTILAAITARKGPGVTIQVNPGVYREQISIPASGAAGSPFTLRAGGPGVVIEGSESLSGAGVWDQVDGDLYVTNDVNWSAKQVFVDGVRLTLSTSDPALLTAGQFVYVGGQGLYVNLGGTDPGTRAVQVSKRNNAFTMSSRSFVTIDGFEIARSNDRGINLHTCADVVISNNLVQWGSGTGIHANNCQRLTIEHNVSSDSQMHGIALTAGTSASTVRDNECARNFHPTVRLGNGIYLFGAPDNVLERNNLHHNQDSGMHFGAGSDTCLARNNRSWANGDHGYDHLQAAGTLHVHDLAYANFRDGFSFEGSGPNSRLYNSISVDNGLTQNRFDLWVEAGCLIGFDSDYNLFWNSNSQPIIKTGTTLHSTLATHQASGLDLHSRQSNPWFANATQGDFSLLEGSPAIDVANSAVESWPSADALGNARSDDPHIANSGAGPVLYADLGPLERAASDAAPLVSSPGFARASVGGTVSFTVSVSDPDGDPIQGLTMIPVRMPPGHGATFQPNANNTGGTFTWVAGEEAPGNYLVEFVATNTLSGSSRTPIELLPASDRPEVHLTDDPPADPLWPIDNGGPDPAAGVQVFTHSLRESATLDWAIYDLQGREIWFETRTVAAGRFQLRWHGLDRNGVRAARGVYFARVRLGNSQFVRRVVRL